MTPVVVGGVTFGGGQLAVIAGPCVVEDDAFTIGVAEALRDISRAAGVGFVFKASFDKANRTSLSSPRGRGMDAGLELLSRIRRDVGVPVLTDIHESWQAAPVAEAVDVLQIPAFLCRQTDLVVAAAATGRVVNVKKAQFLAPDEMRHVVGKLESAGASGVLVTERGTTFGYHTLVVDFRSLPVLRALGHPVVFDATHSVQQPGAADGRSGGQRAFAPYLARAAVAVGVDALFMEVHPDPDNAPSDGPNMVRLEDVGSLLRDVVALRGAAPALPPIG